MANTYIDTNTIPRRSIPGSGEFAEILNNQLAGAKHVVATLHWLTDGDWLDVVRKQRERLLLVVVRHLEARALEIRHETSAGIGDRGVHGDRAIRGRKARGLLIGDDDCAGRHREEEHDDDEAESTAVHKRLLMWRCWRSRC